VTYVDVVSCQLQVKNLISLLSCATVVLLSNVKIHQSVLYLHVDLPNATLCDAKDFDCVADRKSKQMILLMSSVKTKYVTKYATVFLSEGQQNEEDCEECLPSCTQVTYNAKVTYAPLKPDILQR
jgi:hypothetical protein